MDTVVGLIVDPFGYGFMLRALYVSVLVGIVCPILGAFVVTRGLAFMGDAMSHAVLPGLVVAFMLGVSPFLAAVPAGMGVAFLIGLIARRTGVSQDTSIGILFAGLFALGLALLAKASGVSVDLEDLLLGQVLAVSETDVIVTAGLVVVVQPNEVRHADQGNAAKRRDRIKPNKITLTMVPSDVASASPTVPRS